MAFGSTAVTSAIAGNELLPLAERRITRRLTAEEQAEFLRAGTEVSSARSPGGPASPMSAGSSCDGRFPPGTYSAVEFEPSLSFTVDDGWPRPPSSIHAVRRGSGRCRGAASTGRRTVQRALVHLARPGQGDRRGEGVGRAPKHPSVPDDSPLGSPNTRTFEPGNRDRPRSVGSAGPRSTPSSPPPRRTRGRYVRSALPSSPSPSTTHSDRRRPTTWLMPWAG